MTIATSTIWKFVLSPECSFSMPAGAEILSAKEQNGIICLWAKLDPAAPQEMRHFKVVGTGLTFWSEDLKFIDTVLMDRGTLVFHVFERLLPK